jgi:hypothetical protein
VMTRLEPGLVEEMMVVGLLVVGYERVMSEVESEHDFAVDEEPRSEVESEEDSLVSSSFQQHHPHSYQSLELEQPLHRSQHWEPD